MARTIGRGCLAAVLLVLLIAALGIVYFTLRPPFQLPETGYLETNTSREVRLRPESPVAVLELGVRHDPRIFSESSRRFDPTRLKITTTVVGDADLPTGLRLYPVDRQAVTDLSATPDGRSTDWLIDCETVESRDCARTYLVVVNADNLDAEVVIKVEMSAKLRFPAHVPTPFLVSIGLDAHPVRTSEPGIGLLTTAVEGSILVSPQAPVADQSLASSTANTPLSTGSGMPVAGITLRLTVTRDGEAIPVGLHAPPPVRVAIVSGDDESVLVDVGPRPGTPVLVAMGPLPGEARLVAWWQDRAAQGYRVDWHLEHGIVGHGPAPIGRVGTSTASASIARKVASGESRMLVGANRPDLELGVGVDIGEVDRERLPPTAGVLRLQLELDAAATTDPLILLLSTSDYSGDESIPVTLRAGETVELALDAVAHCDRGRCPPWRGRVRIPGWAASSADETVLIRWRAEFDLWRLDPSAEPPSFYEIDG
jgi:hypothetical protein